MKILIAVDRSEYAEIVLEHGLDQAVRESAGELHVVTVLPGEGGAAEAHAWLEELVGPALDAFGCTELPVTLHVHGGETAPTIAALVRELVPDLLVVGRFQVPSTSDEVLPLVGCPTLVVGIEGHVLEPQCPACEAVRTASSGEELFCPDHTGGELTEVTARLPPLTSHGSRMW